MTRTQMTEKGIVEEVLPNGEAYVRVKRSSACEGCSQSSLCWGDRDAEIMRVKVEVPFTCESGQLVDLVIDTTNFVKYSFITYIVPVLLLIAGSIVAATIASIAGSTKEYWSFVGGVIGVIAGVFFIKRYSERLGKDKTITVRVINAS